MIEAWFGKLPENPKEYHAHIANCLIVGELPSIVDNQEVRNLISLKLDGFDLRLVQNPEFIITNRPHRGLDGLVRHTTDLVIPELEPADFERAQQLSREVAVLLSFATASEVWNFGYDYSSIDPVQEREAFMGRIHTSNPVIDTRSGRAIREFLEQTLPTFRALRYKRQLDVAFDYFVLSQLEKQIELSLVVTFVLLENLKSTYAKEQGYPFSDGYFRKPNKKPYRFEELLKAMFKVVGMLTDLSLITSLRNEIIHSGITHLGISERFEIFSLAQDVIREYLLKLLGYTGEFNHYSQKKFISF